MDKVKLSTFLDIINADLIIRRYNNQNERWYAKIEESDIKDDCFLVGSYGSGKNPNEAINDYLKEIRGKKIVLSPYDKNKRKEFIVPKEIYNNYE